MNEATRIINAIEQGDSGAAEELLPLVYEELRFLAVQKMAQEKPGQTLQATALVHEAYLRLVEGQGRNWNSRGHFFKAAAEAMRRILIDGARRKNSIRRGAQIRRVGLEAQDIAAEAASTDLLALDDALTRLAAEDPTKADLVKLRYFAGLTVDQAAEMLGISRATAIRHWAFARTWLLREVRKGD